MWWAKSLLTTTGRVLEFVMRRGRRRCLAYLIVIATTMAGAFHWVGNGGAALMALWGAAVWPRWQQRRVGWPLAEMQAVWLWANTAAVKFYDGSTACLFCDELSDAEFARVRRELKSQIDGLL